MKRIITIGDLHGRTIWKDFADIKFLLYAEPDAAGFGGFVPEYYKYVFLGDYCDSFTITSDQIRENLLELIRFKMLYPEHVILLWGNHDLQYWINDPWKKMDGTVSGYRPESHFDLFDIFNTNRDLFQFAYQEGNYLWTHAGVNFSWYHNIFAKEIKGRDMDDMNVAEQLNVAFRYKLDCLFDIDFYRGGHKKIGGPLWCDKKLVDKNPLKNTHQIVGHSPVSDIDTYKLSESTSITFCDVLHHRKSFYTIII